MGGFRNASIPRNKKWKRCIVETVKYAINWLLFGHFHVGYKRKEEKVRFPNEGQLKMCRIALICKCFLMTENQQQSAMWITLLKQKEHLTVLEVRRIFAAYIFFLKTCKWALSKEISYKSKNELENRTFVALTFNAFLRRHFNPDSLTEKNHRNRKNGEVGEKNNFMWHINYAGKCSQKICFIQSIIFIFYGSLPKWYILY